jgi:hypothetical protein
METLRHPTELNPSVEEVAVELANMRYDRISVFLSTLRTEIIQQAAGDAGRGRQKLAGLLVQHAADLNAAIETMDKIWKLCEPHMENNAKSPS